MSCPRCNIPHVGPVCATTPPPVTTKSALEARPLCHVPGCPLRTCIQALTHGCLPTCINHFFDERIFVPDPNARMCQVPGCKYATLTTSDRCEPCTSVLGVLPRTAWSRLDDDF